MMPSVPQLLIMLVTLALVLAIPYFVFGPVARKAGFSPWWSLLIVLPFVNIAAIWMFAFAKWPAEENR